MLKKRFGNVRLFGICDGLLLLAGLEPCSGIAQSQRGSAPLSSEMKALLRMDAPVVLVRHVTIFDGTGTPAKHDQSILIDHGRIASVGPDSSVRAPDTATVVDGTGKTLLSGLVGMHEHLFFPKTGAGMVLATVLGKSAPRMYLGAGVTTARTTGSIEPVTDLAIKRMTKRASRLDRILS
jgi:imidazolonepropionase-like amidohydrolase